MIRKSNDILISIGIRALDTNITEANQLSISKRKSINVPPPPPPFNRDLTLGFESVTRGRDGVTKFERVRNARRHPSSVGVVYGGTRRGGGIATGRSAAGSTGGWNPPRGVDKRETRLLGVGGRSFTIESSKGMSSMAETSRYKLDLEGEEVRSARRRFERERERSGRQAEAQAKSKNG